MSIPFSAFFTIFEIYPRRLKRFSKISYMFARNFMEYVVFLLTKFWWHYLSAKSKFHSVKFLRDPFEFWNFETFGNLERVCTQVSFESTPRPGGSIGSISSAEVALPEPFPSRAVAVVFASEFFRQISTQVLRIYCPKFVSSLIAVSQLTHKPWSLYSLQPDGPVLFNTSVVKFRQHVVHSAKKTTNVPSYPNVLFLGYTGCSRTYRRNSTLFVR